MDIPVLSSPVSHFVRLAELAGRHRERGLGRRDPAWPMRRAISPDRGIRHGMGNSNVARRAASTTLVATSGLPTKVSSAGQATGLRVVVDEPADEALASPAFLVVNGH